MNPSALTVYTSPFPKIRIGKDGDGGYIVADVPNAQYDLLLAGGIDNDISFEEQFTSKYDMSKCFAFDGTITNAPRTTNSRIEFVRRNIGGVNDGNVSNLHDIVDSYDKIFVKMDIEGHEIPWLISLKDEHMNKFEQIVMEFHNPFSNIEAAVFEKINRTHHLIHFHPNNCCSVRHHGGVWIPNIFECTYLHNKYFASPPALSTDPIPGPLDMKNTDKPEIRINYPPFVHSM